MMFDSLAVIAAAALFAAAVGAWRLSTARKPYLRFAAMLLAALASSALLHLADAAALLLLPLASASLALAALARFTRPAAPRIGSLVASIVLVVALGCGLAALMMNAVLPALLPAVLAALVIVATALNGMAPVPVLAGVSLLAGVLAYLQQGAQAGMLLFCAAAVIGLAGPFRTSAPAVDQQGLARRGAAIGRMR